MPPQSGNGGSFVVPLSLKAFAEEVISQNTSLREAITSAEDFEVDPAVWSCPWRLYSSMNLAGISETLMRTYSGYFISMSR
jgi:hypothetical protein